MRSTHRVYLNMLQSSPQQVENPTRWYYDINADDVKDTSEARWYRVTSASAGKVYDMLLQVDATTTSRLGGHMQLFGSRWYVAARDVDLERALEIRPLVQLTNLQTLALIVVMLGGLTLWLVGGGHVQFTGDAPSMFPIVAGVGGVAIALMIADFIVQRKMR
jgi:hypothetical protein